jgi:hypothetical protein
MGGLEVREPRGFDVRLHAGAHMLETLPQQRADIGRPSIHRGVVADKFTI